MRHLRALVSRKAFTALVTLVGLIAAFITIYAFVFADKSSDPVVVSLPQDLTVPARPDGGEVAPVDPAPGREVPGRDPGPVESGPCKAKPLPATFEREIENADDRDRFQFCTGAHTGSIRAKLTFTGTQDTAAQVEMVLKGPDGKTLRESDSTDDEGPASLEQNAPPNTIYTIEVRCYAQFCSTDYGGSTYRLDVSGDRPF